MTAPTRDQRLNDLADFHEEWVAENVEAASQEFNPSGRKKGSDYNQHHVDLDAGGDAQDEFDQMARHLLGLDEPPTTAAGGLSGAELEEFNRLHRRDRKGRFADRIGNAISSGVAGALDEFTREQLRSYATRERGLVLPRGASVDVIKERLLKSAGKQVAGAVALEPSPLPDRAALGRKTIPQLRELAKEHGIRVPAKAKKAEIVDLLAGHGAAGPLDGVAAARLRLADLENARSRAKFLSRVEGLVDGEVSGEALSRAVRSAATVNGIEVDDPQLKPLLAAADTGDTAAILAEIDKIAEAHGLQRIGKAGEMIPFDRTLHADIGSSYGGPGHLRDGQKVWVVRPGYHVTRDGEKIRLEKAIVEEATPQEAAAGLLQTSGVFDAARPQAERETTLRQAVRLPPQRVQALSGGITAGAVERVFVPGGGSYVKKSYGGDPLDAPLRIRSEILGSKILNAVGVDAPAVVQIDDHSIAMEFVAGRQGGQTGVLKAPKAVVESDVGRRIGLADALMGYRDRAGGNWMTGDDGRIVPIDNDGAFLFGQRAAAGNPFTSYIMGKHETSPWKSRIDLPSGVDLDQVKSNIEALKPDFDRLGAARDYRMVLDRLGEIEKRAIVKPPMVAAAVRKLSGDALEEFNQLHPRGFRGRFGHKTGPVSGARSAVLAGDFRGLKRVGGQLGFNTAALYEDDHGQKWYVKAQPSPEHAANEALASALYRATSIVSPEVHTGSGAPGLGDGPQTASEWMDLSPADKTDPSFRKQVQFELGVHAWLANWDVAGAGGRDNVEVEKGTPFPVTVDSGGALLYRGAGRPKSDLFGPEVFELDTLRDPRYNPTAARLFGDMTPEKIAEAAEYVEKITPGQIRKLVAEYHMPDSLADTLIARQKDIVRRGEKLRLDLETQDSTDWVSGRAALAAAGSRLSDRPAGQTYDTAAELTFADDPGWTEEKTRKVADILRFYRTGTFRRIGEFMRGQSDDDTLRIQDSDEEGNPVGPARTEKVGIHVAYMHDAFDKSPLQQPVQLYRGVHQGQTVWGDAWRPDADMTGVEWTEPSPTSTTASEGVGRIFGGHDGAVMRLHVPAGVGAIQLSGWPTKEAHTREAELVLQPGLRYRIIGDHRGSTEVAGYTLNRRVLDVLVEVPDEGQ